MALRSCSHARSVTSNLLSTFCQPVTAVPTFLAPSTRLQCRALSVTTPKRSKIGNAALSVPDEVTFAVLTSGANENAPPGQADRTVEINGPLGKLSMPLPPYVSITTGEEGKTRHITIEDVKDKKQKAMWGTVRAYLNNHILGVSEGHTAILRLVGVGYRATIEDKATTKQPEYPGQKFVSLKVGYSHPIELGIPPGVKASTPQPTRILLEGVEKEVVMQFAAIIRAWRKPEPYKGKGIFVNGETIRLKAKKIK